MENSEHGTYQTDQNTIVLNQNSQAYQNVPVSGQDSRAAQGTSSPESRKPVNTKIIIGLLVAFVVGLLAIGITICILKNGVQDDNIQDSQDSGVQDGDSSEDAVSAADRAVFENMTKAEAMAFLQASKDTMGNLPVGYVGEEIANATIVNGNTIVSDLKLIYSYDGIEELRQRVEEKYQNFLLNNTVDSSDYEIKEYDYYAIVTPNGIKGATSCDHGYNTDCDSLLSFKRSYLDYLLEEISPNSFRDVAYVNTRDPEIVEYLMRVFTFFSTVGFGGHGNIYDYSFEEQSDKFVLTVYYVGAGLSLEKLQDGSSNSISGAYAINLFLRRYAVDKANGEFSIMPTESGTMENIKSLPLTQEELSSLLAD